MAKRVFNKETVPDNSMMSDYLSFYRSPMYDPSMFQPYNPDDLVRKFGGNQALSKYEKLKQDDAVKAALFTKKAAVIATGWKIEPASLEQSDVDIAMAIDDNLRNDYTGNFENSLMEILSAFEYGYSVTEQIFSPSDGRVILSELKTQPPHSFEFDTDDHGNIKPEGFRQWTAQGKLEVLPRWKFILYVHDQTFGHPYGNSDLRAAYRSWFSKDMIIRFQNIYLERFGMPLPIGRYAKTASKADRENLRTMLQTMTAKTSFILPEDAKVEFQKDQSQASDIFSRAIEQHNTMITRSILMPNLLGFGETKGGSFALGEKQFDVFLWILERERRQLETTMKDQVIRRLVDFNFHGTKRLPKFVFNPLTEADKHERAKEIIEALKSGVVEVNLDTENYLRGLLGLPKIEADVSRETIKVKKEEFKFSRQPNKYEKKVDFAFIEASFNGAEEMLDGVKDVLKKIRDDFTNQVVRKKVIESKNVAAMNSLEFRFIRDLGLEIEAILRDGYDNGKKSAKDTTKKAEFAAPVSGIGLVKTKSLQWIKEKSKILTGNIAQKLQDQAKDVVLDGIQKGLPVYDVVDKIDNLFSSYVATKGVEGEASDGMRLYTEINTKYAQAFASGLGEYYAPLEAEGYIEAYEFSAVIDGATTKECDELDGLVFGVNNAVWDKVTPPIWWNCRSVRVPIFKGEEWVEDDVPGIVSTSENIF